MKILLTNDYAALLRALTRQLETVGHTVVTAVSADDACVIIHNDVEIEAVLTDWDMPLLNGRAVYRGAGAWVVAAAIQRQLPIFVISNAEPVLTRANGWCTPDELKTIAMKWLWTLTAKSTGLTFDGP